MNVLFVASEAAPFAKTGGLADVIGSLPKELNRQGINVQVILPKYEDIPENFKERMETVQTLTVALAWRNQYCGLQRLKHEGVVYYFIDNEYYFKRRGLYGYGDEAERFAFFGRAVLEVLPYLEDKPDVLHLHDWQTGLIPVFLHAHYKTLPDYEHLKTVFTIHNLKYQGIFSPHILQDILDLGNEYFTTDGLEFYGAVNCMKGGLTYSDRITTVSETYTEEIQTAYYGERLEGLLRKRSADLFGILNGIDYERYDPMNDPHLFANYGNSIADKRKNKTALQQMLSLPVNEDKPMVVMVSRLVQQKGLDLIHYMLDELMELDLQLVILGTGDYKYERMLKEAEFRHRGKCSVHVAFDDPLSRKIYAASDMFLMPSLFEPCGIGQLLALRYRSVPIVRETGGLRDTVTAYNEFTGEGTGFSFVNYNAHDMLHTIRRALSFYRDERHWEQLLHNIDQVDFSWKRSAKQYIDLYEGLVTMQ